MSLRCAPKLCFPLETPSIVPCQCRREAWVQFLGWEDPLEMGIYLLHCSWLENPMDRGVHRVAQSQTRLEWLSMHAYRVKENRKRYRKHQAKFCWIIEKARKFQKNICLCFIDYAKAFDCVDHNELWKALKEMGTQDHLTCLLRNLYVGQEAIVRTRYGTTGWFKIEKGIQQGCLLSPCLFNLYTEHIMRNAGLNELQAGVSR